MHLNILAAREEVKFALYVSSIIVISCILVTKHLPFGGKKDCNLSFKDFAFIPNVIATAETAMQFFKNEKLCEFVLIS